MFIEDYIDTVSKDKNDIIGVINTKKQKKSVSGLSYDSRRCGAGHIFFCKGRDFKTEYLIEACENGACAVFCEPEINVSEISKKYPKCTFVRVCDVRRAMAVCSAFHYGYPFKKLTTVAVTGTKGKTSTVHCIKNILSETRGIRVAILSETVSKSAPRLTTPEAPDMHEAAYRALKMGITHLICEISSQAMSEKRCYGIEFDHGCFLNFGRDHISPREHQSEEEYFMSKASLFLQCRSCVINLDCEKTAFLTAFINKNRPYTAITGFSFNDERANCFGHDLRTTAEGCSFEVTDKNGQNQTVCLSMHGRYNAENALAAYSVCSLLGADNRALFCGILHTHVEGRGEEIDTLDGKVKVIVDYAHNEMSFRALFEYIRNEYGEDRGITAIFGCPGEKAFERRRQLPSIAQKYADRIIICEDDSGKEPFERIKNDILSAIDNKHSVSVIKNRAEAIRLALTDAFENGESRTIVFAGKGRETKMRTRKGDADCVSDYDLALGAVSEYNARLSLGSVFSSISAQNGRLTTIVAEDGKDIAESLAFAVFLLLKNGALCLAVCSENGAKEIENACFTHGTACEIITSPAADDIKSICRRGTLALCPSDKNYIGNGADIAVSLNSDHLVYLTNREGILLNGRIPIPKLSVSSAELITLNGEYAYLPEMLRAHRGGVKSCAAVDGRKRNELALFLSGAPFSGTLFS